MSSQPRREFLADVGRGMLVASLGSATAFDLGLSGKLQAGEPDQRVTFGPLEPLVSLVQETPPDKLQPLLIEKIKSGESLKTLVSAAALANVRAFAGQDYIGYHTFMALVPAWQMAAELPSSHQALPVLKVLYRNSSRIQAEGAGTRDALHPIVADADETGQGRTVRDAVHAADMDAAERRFARVASGPSGEAFNHLQYAVQDEVDVHRVVLSWRAFAMLDLAGQEYAHSLLRQSVRYCVNVERTMQERDRPRSPIRTLLPQLMDEHRLLSKPPGTRRPDDAWMEELATVIFSGTREQAAAAVATAIAEDFDLKSVGEAISLAANKLLLHDPGRLEKYSNDQKPPGCVHGDSVGVHASDAANAWRHISRVSNARNRISSLIVGAFHTAGQSQWVTQEPYPYANLLEEIRETDAQRLLALTEEAILANDQARACAIAQRFGDLNLPARPLFNLLLKYGCSQDGALHAEKYYRTASEEFAAARPAFRWRQLVALARVTASEFGHPAPGYQDACDRLGIV